ncbi:MAG: inner membrane protein [Saprospiraceae bacterium]|jgi:inner membrane protein
MDSITQAVLGAAIGEAVAGKKIGYKAAVVGAIVATIPDLDVLFIPFLGELQKMSFHRGYSHSIAFCILASFLIAIAMGKIKWVGDLSFRKAYLLSFFALFTHVLLDAFTTYGTQLLLPLSDWRVSFDSINIIDPFYTIPLLIGVAVSLYFYNFNDPKRSSPNNIGLIISSIYLLFTLANKQHIQREFYTQLKSQNIPSYGLLTVPVKIGNMQWYGVAKDASNLYIGKYDILTDNEIDFHSFPINNQLLNDIDPDLDRRLNWVSQGYYTVAEKDDVIRVYNMQCDMQGVRTYGDYKAPTAFYYQITPTNGSFELSTGMHMEEE